MSQQQMDSGEINRDESRLSSREYEAGAHYDRDTSVLYGQKLTAIMNSSSPSPGQRLALAIVSLTLWVVVFFIVVLSLITTPSTIFVESVASTTSYDNQAWYVLYPLVIAGLLIFSILVFAINLLFYRKR
jgi:hypothetical protein